MKKDLPIKILFIVLIIVSLYLIISGLSETEEGSNTNNGEVLEQGLQLSNLSVELKVGEDYQVVAVVLPENATYKNVEWKSSNPTIATVDNGLIHAVSDGNCIIQAATEKMKITRVVSVTVKPIIIDVEKIVVTTPSIDLFVGDTARLEYTVEPENATNKNLSIISENPEVVSFNSDGLIVGISKGETNILLKSNNNIQEKIHVSVKEKDIPVESVSLNKKEISLTVGGSETLKATVKPSNATNKDITWKSSDKNIATVNKSGKVTAKKAGSATITVTTSDGKKTAKAKVTVKAKQASPIVPSNYNQKYESNTFKYYVVNTGKYYLTYIWMQDPVNQIKKLEANTAKYGKVLRDSEITGTLYRAPVGEMMNDYISKGLISTSKAAVGYNASGFFVNGSWTPPSPYYHNRSNSWLVITDGIITRSRTDDGVNTDSILAAIDGNGNLRIIDGGISKADRERTVQTLKDANVRNTWSFAPLLISDGVQKPWGSTEYARRQGICQINSNNYVMLTSYTGMLIDDVGSVFKSIGCKTAFNFDGGGSTQFFIKNAGDYTATRVQCSDGSSHTACRSTIEGIYFVEK